MQSLATLQTQFDDRDLERRVVNYLEGRHVPGLRHLSVQARSGIVTLRGKVQTFYEKQLCLDCCRRVAGVVKYVDAVDVAYSQPAAELVGAG
jgi:osmotically-inducible protein OsmY